LIMSLWLQAACWTDRSLWKTWDLFSFTLCTLSPYLTSLTKQNWFHGTKVENVLLRTVRHI